MESIWLRRYRLHVYQAAKRGVGDSDDGSGSFAAYADYNRILRTWFVAFGIGGPAYFLVNEKIAERLAKIGELRYVATLFIVGAAAQILGSLLNKAANWYVYRSTWNDAATENLRFRIAEWLSDQFLIDLGLDAVTVVSFGLAAWILLTAFA